MSFGLGARGTFATVDASAACPCGSGERFDVCCAPLHAGEKAPSAERLMRSRYTAFVVGDVDYLTATWHGSTRPESLALDPRTRWQGLEIVQAQNEGTRAVVEFRARFRENGRAGQQHERSRFIQRAGRWFYLDADG